MGLNMGTEFQFPVGPVQNTNVQISDIVDIAQITHVLKRSCCWLACFGRDWITIRAWMTTLLYDHIIPNVSSNVNPQLYSNCFSSGCLTLFLPLFWVKSSEMKSANETKCNMDEAKRWAWLWTFESSSTSGCLIVCSSPGAKPGWQQDHLHL